MSRLSQGRSVQIQVQYIKNGLLQNDLKLDHLLSFGQFNRLGKEREAVPAFQIRNMSYDTFLFPNVA